MYPFAAPHNRYKKLNDRISASFISHSCFHFLFIVWCLEVQLLRRALVASTACKDGIVPGTSTALSKQYQYEYLVPGTRYSSDIVLYVLLSSVVYLSKIQQSTTRYMVPGSTLIYVFILWRDTTPP